MELVHINEKPEENDMKLQKIIYQAHLPMKFVITYEHPVI